MAQVARGVGLGHTLHRGQVLSDSGRVFTTVQEAENDASDWIFIAPGTFQEAVVIDTAGLAVYGSGRDTLIDGGTDGDAISIEAANVLIQNLSVQTTAGGGNSFDGIATGTGGDAGTIRFVWVRDSDANGIRPVNGFDWIIVNCVIESADGSGISIGAERCIVAGSIVTGTSGSGIASTSGSDDSIISNNEVLNCNNGVAVSTTGDVVISGNRIINSTNDGFNTNLTPTDLVVANNRISGSGTADIDDQATNTLLHGNRTGAAS